MRWLLLFSLLYFQESIAQNVSIKSFNKAKSLLKKIYGKENKTFYCQCPYQKKSIKTKKCDLKIKKFKKRKKRLEWEHVVPAHAFGQSFEKWRKNKTLCKKKKNNKYKTPRKCAQEDPLFASMESDIYNLVPSVGAINAMRNKYSFAQFSPKTKPLCPGFFIENKKVLPPNELRGDIARIYMYMDQAYPGRGIISGKNKKLFQAWDKLDPVNEAECEMVRKKQTFQKSINSIVMTRCEKSKK